MIECVILVGLLAFAIWGAWLARNLRLMEFISNRSRGSTLDIFFTLLGSLVGGYMFFGLTAIAYEAGTVASAIGFGYCVGLFLLALAVPRIKRLMNEHDCDTMDDFLGAVLGSKVQGIVSLINFGFFIAVVAAQFIAMTSYLAIVAPAASKWLPLLAALLVIAYTALAGYKGVILTDIPQTLVLGIAAMLIFVVLALNTDWSQEAHIAESHLVPTGYGVGFLVGVIVFFPLTLLVRSDLWQRIAHAKSAKAAQRGFLLTIPVLFLFYCIFTAIGIMAYVTVGSDANPEASGIQAFVQILQQQLVDAPYLAKALLGIVSLGIYAALLSTADSNLNIGSVALAKLLFAEHWSKWSEIECDRFSGERLPIENTLLVRTRLISALAGLSGLAIAYLLPDIVGIMVACAAILMIFLPTVFGALFLGHRNPIPSIFSIVAGLIAFIGFALTLPNYKISFLPAGFIALCVYAISKFLYRGAR